MEFQTECSGETAGLVGFLVWARDEEKGGQGDSGWIFMEIMINMFLSELQYMLHNKNKGILA